jgi:hypothetical protein
MNALALGDDHRADLLVPPRIGHGMKIKLDIAGSSGIGKSSHHHLLQGF